MSTGTDGEEPYVPIPELQVPTTVHAVSITGPGLHSHTTGFSFSCPKNIYTIVLHFPHLSQGFTVSLI